MAPNETHVVAVSRKATHGVDKANQLSIRLWQGRGSKATPIAA